jgi:ATP-dependent RNA helicase DDX41
VLSGDDEGGDGSRPLSAAAQRARESLLVSTARARAAAPEKTEEEKVIAEEQDIMRNLMQKQALKAVQELAQGVTYTKSMQTGWKAPLGARRMSHRRQQVRLVFAADVGSWSAGAWAGIAMASLA